MILTQFLKTVVERLNKENLHFALAGGMVASLYRDSIRATNDLDLLIAAPSHTLAVAQKIINDLNLAPHIIRKADLEGGPLFARKRKNTTPYIVAGRGKESKAAIGLDLILPEIPWAAEALSRAQKNKVDFGFGPIACLTVEDVIVSKLYSYQNDATRFNDLDDLKSIFKTNPILDFIYLTNQMKQLQLRFPQVLQSLIPRTLKVISRSIKKREG